MSLALVVNNQRIIKLYNTVILKRSRYSVFILWNDSTYNVITI